MKVHSGPGVIQAVVPVTVPIYLYIPGTSNFTNFALEGNAAIYVLHTIQQKTQKTQKTQTTQTTQTTRTTTHLTLTHLTNIFLGGRNF
jgi:hypothetical protein